MSSMIEEHLGIAVVDDDAVFRELTCALLSASTPYIPFPAASGEELMELLREQRVDCILMDYDMGGDTGLAIKTKVDERFSEPPPMVMLTGDGRESTAIKAFRMGVNDYLPKLHLQPKTLAATISQVVIDARQRQSVKAEHRRLVEAAAIDLITGLEGTQQLDKRLVQLAGLKARFRQGYALVLVDLLQYQSITEQFGLKVSDLAIRSFGKQVKLSTRSNDICGRYDNGTFLIIADVSGDGRLLESLCHRIAQDLSIVFQVGSAKLQLTGCVAGTMCAAIDEDRISGPLFYEGAARHLEQAKEAGLSCSIVLAPVTKTSASEMISRAGASSAEPASLPAADQLRVTNRRSAPRQRVFKRGVIHVLKTNATFNCTIRNLSGNGAGLRVDTPFAVPDAFDLEIVGSGEKVSVNVRWQSSIDVGVQYQPTPRADL